MGNLCKRSDVLSAWLVISALGISMLACSIFSPASPTPTIALPTDTPSGPCEATAPAEVTIYMRPDPAAEVFSTQGPGFSIEITAQTATGWLGFDPGVAQAANIGSFRLRWLDPSTVETTGDCGSLPVVWGPPAEGCFDMPMEDVEVHAGPSDASPILATLHVEEFAAILGLNGAGWAKVDLGPGNTGLAVVGWVDAATLNMNGPCEALPTVTE